MPWVTLILIISQNYFSSRINMLYLKWDYNILNFTPIYLHRSEVAVGVM